MSALPILDFKENSYEILIKNFNSVLSKVGNLPFALISINGATRTGKSYALNYFLRYLTSAQSWPKVGETPKFLAKSGKARTTLGIDLWSEPFIIKVEGREIAVLLMDCQGLFDDQTTGTQNAIIFSLSSLCSSMSVFNVIRNIDESILQQIQFFAGYAHLVSREKGKNSEGKEEQKQNEENPFQRLLFLIRDFDFPDYACGYHGDSRKVQCSSKINNESKSVEASKNYCVDTFYPPGGDKSSTKTRTTTSNVFVREEILMNYKDVSCFLLPHPGKQFTQDDQKSTDADFAQFMKEFVELVLSPGNLVTKRIGGQEITGNDFKKFVEEWGKLCEKAEDKFPTVQTIAESTATIQNTLALYKATLHYAKVMSSFEQNYPCGLPASEFLKFHEKLQSEAMEIFNSRKKFSGEKLAEEHRQSLNENISKLCESIRTRNLELVSKAAKDDELKKKNQEVSEVQRKLSAREIQTQRENEETKRAIGDLQQKMAQDSVAASMVWSGYHRQRNIIKSQEKQLAQAAEVERNALMAQLYAANARELETARKWQSLLQN